MPILKSLDVLIGASGILLLLSMVVTMLTQIVVDALRLRSAHLRQGILEIAGEAGTDLQVARGLLEASYLKRSPMVTADEIAKLAGTAIDTSAFDAAMARVSARFTASSRAIVCVIAMLVAAAIPLDFLDLLRTLSSGGGLAFPETLAQWAERWQHVNVAGIGVSAALLSLGAPFWFEVLKDMLKLRSGAVK